MSNQSVDARQFGYSWSENNTAQDDPPTQQLLEFQLVRQYVNHPPQVWNLDGQGPFKEYVPEPVTTVALVPSVEFRIKCILWHWTQLTRDQKPGDVTKVFTCSMEDTRIILGKRVSYPPYPSNILPRMLEGDPIKWGVSGPFIESVNVRMGFTDPAVPALLYQRSPDTDREMGDVSSTVSYGFNFGFFGSDFTGSFDANYSNSTSMQLTDYRIRSQSDQRFTDHTIEMAMLEGGQPYKGWEQAPDPVALPPRATSDMRLGMQGVWELPGSVSDTLDFKVDVTVTFQTFCYRDYASFRQLGIRDSKLEYPGYYNYVPTTGKWGTGSAVVAGQQIPNPMGDRHWQRTLTWSRTIKVPMAQVNKPVGVKS